MTDPINGRELLAIRARCARAAQGNPQSRQQIEADREKLMREVYRLRHGRAVRALIARREQGIANLWAANGEEEVDATRAMRAIKADTLDTCIRELRDALTPPAVVSTATEAHGETTEAQEARE